MTRIEQLELALGILLEHASQDVPSNPRMMPEWFVACAQVDANQTDATTHATLKRAHAAAVARIKARKA